MSSMNQEAIVLKSDVAGQVQIPVERRVALVREFERSGLSGPKFASLAGVKHQTFVTWRRKHGSAGPARRQSPANPVSFVEAMISARAPGVIQGQAPETEALVMELLLEVKLHLRCPAHIPLAAQLILALNDRIDIDKVFVVLEP